MLVSGEWSLEELVARVAQVLAADGVRAPNGRVRDAPDARAIRWYATIGLVDRPSSAGRPGRRYGSRHLLQVVAVKRRQAAGRSLAEIQAELAGATDATLRRVARVPEELATPAPVAKRDPVRGGAGPYRPGGPGHAAERIRFWSARAAPAHEQFPPSAAGPNPPAGPARANAPAAAVRYLVTLADGVTLALPTEPAAGDVAAVRAAAAPLLDLLAARGLIATDHPSKDDRGCTSTKEPEDDHHAA